MTQQGIVKRNFFRKDACMAKSKKTKCYIYTRVSTAMQVDGYSLDAQKEKLKRYADYEEMEIVGIKMKRTT